MVPLREQVALITGAASGIGRACALELARQGAELVLVDIDEAGLAGAAEEVRAAGARAGTFVCDVSREDRVRAMADEVLASRGRVDLLFNNAGVAVAAPVATMRREDWEWIVGVNLWGAIHVTQAFLPAMLARGSGHLVATASLAGLIGAPGMAAYSMTKFGLVGFFESLRLEVANCGVDVTVICPGYVKTNLARATRYGNGGFQRFLGAPPSWYGIPVERAARRMVAGIRRREPLVVLGPEAAGWWIKRLWPGAAFHVTRRVARWAGVLDADREVPSCTSR